jgi:hypothetical protein
MRVCLMLSGMLRDNSSYASLQRDIIKPYGADVYCQFWSSSQQQAAAEAHTISSCYEPVQLLQQLHLNLCNNFSEQYYPQLQQLTPFLVGNRHNQILSQLLGMKNASNMFNWSNYDFIIRARYDKINLQRFPDLNKLDADTFYADCCYNSWFQQHDKFFIDRNFIMPNSMKKICEGFDLLHDKDFCVKLYNWTEKECGDKFTYDFWPEYLLAYLFTHYGLQHKFKKLSCDEYHIST